jgi:hypothetical protein
MNAARARSVPCCPVCGSSGRPLLQLTAQPIYQHPVPEGTEVAAPHLVDLSWMACVKCAHGWQVEIDGGLLESIYRSHYYTPAPGGMAVTFRNEFMAAMGRFGLLRPRRKLLEIGASDGDVLAELQQRTKAAEAYAFEPNEENAAIAAQRGLAVHRCFFGRDAAGYVEGTVDFIYARHVIEHIFEFDDFFDGLNAVTAENADLVLETPSLDEHARRSSIAPFHIEHIHVFSLRSLATLALRHRWKLQRSEVTSDGNLIAAFTKIGPHEPCLESVGAALPEIGGLQAAVTSRHDRLRALLADRYLAFWGAGSAGVSMVSTIGREPDLWTDGNPNKIGKVFVGLQSRIASPESVFQEAKQRTAENPLLLITSSFLSEILPRVRQMGWAGEVMDQDGNQVINPRSRHG